MLNLLNLAAKRRNLVLGRELLFSRTEFGAS